MNKAFITLVVVLTGCATASKDTANYVSPMQYQTYDCGQIGQESLRIQARVAELGGRLDQAASNDKTITGAGIILFWPALFFLGGTKQQEAEFARLKGENDALHQASIQKKCALQPLHPQPWPRQASRSASREGRWAPRAIKPATQESPKGLPYPPGPAGWRGIAPLSRTSMTRVARSPGVLIRPA